MESIIKVDSFMVIKEEPLDDYETLNSSAPSKCVTDDGFPLSNETHEASKDVKLEKESLAENSTAVKISKITYSTFKTYGSNPGHHDYSRKPRTVPPIVKTEIPDTVNIDAAYTISHSETDERESKPWFYRNVNAVPHANENNEHPLADGSIQTFSTHRNDSAANNFQALPSGSHACTYGYKTYMTMEKNVVHDREHNKEKPANKCAQGVTTSTQTNERALPKHSQMGEKSYKCKYCEKTFARKSQQTMHERVHTGERPYKCDFCENTFKQRTTRMIHERTHMGIKQYKCDYCEKTFVQKVARTVHERVHTGEKPYKCGYCSMAFACKYNLLRHERQHTDDKPYKCNYCEKTFRQSGQKRRHERMHTSVKPLHCAFCPKRYMRRYDMHCHYKLEHSGKVIFKYNFSGKRFMQKCSKSDTGETPVECKFCGVTFMEKNQMVIHERIHAGEKSYPCSHCDMRFATTCRRKSHERTHMAPTMSVREGTILSDNNFPMSDETHETSKDAKLGTEIPAESSTAMKKSEITYSTFKTYSSTPVRRDYTRKPRATPPIVKTEPPDTVNIDGTYTICNSEMDEREGKPRFYRIVNAVPFPNVGNEHPLADEIAPNFSTCRTDNGTNNLASGLSF